MRCPARSVFALATALCLLFCAAAGGTAPVEDTSFRLPLLPLCELVECTGGRVQINGERITLELTPPATAAEVLFRLAPQDIRIFDTTEFEYESTTPGVSRISLRLFGRALEPLASCVSSSKKEPRTVSSALPDAGFSKFAAYLRVTVTRNKKHKLKPGEKTIAVLRSPALRARLSSLPAALKDRDYPKESLSEALRSEWAENQKEYAAKRAMLGAAPSGAARRALFEELYAMLHEKAWDYEQRVLRAAAGPVPLAYAAANGIDKIRRTGVVPGRVMGKLAIALARNETEAAQLVLYPLRDLSRVSLQCMPLKRRGGGETLASATMVPVGYVTNNTPSYYRLYSEDFPDPLLTYLKEFDLEKDHYQAVWVEVAVPPEQPPGIYTGSVIVRADGAELLKIPLEVTVWDFTLPRFRTFPVAVPNSFRSTSFSHSFAQLYAKDQTVLDEAKRCFQAEEATAENDLSPETRRYLKISREAEQLFRDHFIPSNNDIYSGIDKVLPAHARRENTETRSLFCLGNPYDSRNVCERLRPSVEAARRDGSIRYAYVYGFDESPLAEQKRMHQVFGAIKKEFPEVKTMTTAWDFTCGNHFENWRVTDIWVLPSFCYAEQRKFVNEAKRRGQQVWWYTCDYPPPPSANTMLENSGVATRGLVGFLAWKHRVQGFLYYASTRWRRSFRTENLLPSKQKLSGDATVRAGKNSPQELEYILVSRGQTASVSGSRTVSQKDVSTLRFSLDCEISRFSKSGRAALDLCASIQYGDDTRSASFRLKPDLTQTGTQHLSGVFPLEKPAKSVRLSLRLKSSDAEVRLRNIELRIDHVSSYYQSMLDRPLTGGPVLRGIPYVDNTFACWAVPGKDGVLPTLRLKHLRDGIDDYEYYFQAAKVAEAIAKESAPSPARAAWLKKARAVLKVPKALGESVSVYAKSGDTLLQERAKVAELLEEASAMGLYRAE